MADGGRRLGHARRRDRRATRYFGHDDWAPSPRAQDDRRALEIRRRILIAFERAERDPDPASGRAG